MFERQLVRVLCRRMKEPRGTIQAVIGPRQVGKTTAVRQALSHLDLQSVYASADAPELQGREWLREVWERARAEHQASGQPVLLALDEVQKLQRWTDLVKQLWDEDTWHGRDVHVIVLGSAPLLVGRGLRESMAGRFEVLRATHWTWPEMRDAFGWDLERFVYFGGYPGAAPYVNDELRWREYVRETAIEATISRDLLNQSRIDRPAVLRRLIYLASEYSGRELSYRKILGQLDDLGNTTTVAHYLELLEGVGLVTGLQKYAGEPFRVRASTPKLLVHNTAVMSVMSGRSFAEAKADRAWWGRLVETCVGGHLLALSKSAGGRLHYWRDRGDEVDYVLALGRDLVGVEVKSGERRASLRGMEVFNERFGGKVRTFVVGEGGMTLRDFLESELVRV